MSTFLWLLPYLLFPFVVSPFVVFWMRFIHAVRVRRVPPVLIASRVARTLAVIDEVQASLTVARNDAIVQANKMALCVCDEAMVAALRRLVVSLEAVEVRELTEHDRMRAIRLGLRLRDAAELMAEVVPLVGANRFGIAFTQEFLAICDELSRSVSKAMSSVIAHKIDKVDTRMEVLALQLKADGR